MPLGHRTSSDAEAYSRRHGWGPQWRFPATRSDGRRLALSLRVPADWQASDILQMPADAVASDAALGEAVAALARGIDAAGVIAVIGIEHALPQPGRPDAKLSLLLTVGLRDVKGPTPDSIPGAEVEPVAFTNPDGEYRGVRIRRVRHADAVPGQPPVSMLTMQYLVHTDHGVLASTFVTLQVEAFDKLSRLLDNVAATCWLDAAVPSPA